MNYILALSIVTLSTLSKGMERISSSELKQRTNKTVSQQNKLSRSTSGKLEKVGNTIKKSKSLTSLSKLTNSSSKAKESSKDESRSPSYLSSKKLQFEDPFINKELLKLTRNYDQEAETAFMDGDVKKFQEAYKQIESPRARDALLAKAELLRGLDPQFCRVLVLLSKP